jgi:hypothetical protein
VFSEVTGAGRKPTPPTSPQTRFIFVTPENTSAHQTLMMMTAMVVETSVQYGHLTRLIAREDYIKYIRRESSKTYNNLQVSLKRLLTKVDP